ncbi:MAG: hypothetical protein WBB15_00255 [Ornithinimicrobium sp.]
MKRYLIVANQTLGGDELDREVQERIEGGESHFHVVVPATAKHHQSKEYGGGFDAGSSELDHAHEIAEQRLGQMLEKLKHLGATVDGEVGDPDPKKAVKDVWRDQYFDEVIVSTLPTGLSGWLKADVPNEISAVTGSLVTTVRAE